MEKKQKQNKSSDAGFPTTIQIIMNVIRNRTKSG